jgi:hypothetical protein
MNEIERLTAERDALAAVIDKVRALIDAPYPFVAEHIVTRVRAALAAEPSGPEPTTSDDRRCTCDGGAYIDKMPADWRPFVVNPSCPMHGTTSDEPACENRLR